MKWPRIDKPISLPAQVSEASLSAADFLALVNARPMLIKSVEPTQLQVEQRGFGRFLVRYIFPQRR